MSNRANDHPREECAVFACSLKAGETAAPGICYNGLLALQHRGQEGAGIAALSDGNLICRKNTGLVSEVFTASELQKLGKSALAVGHTRYSTTGTSSAKNVQPFVSEFLLGRIATAHNGNLVNAGDLRNWLSARGVRFVSSSDSEVLSALFAYYCIKEQSIERGVAEACPHLAGAFSLAVLSSEGKLIALRDPDGYRPLCLGKNESGMCIASESAALDSTGFAFVRDVEPGEMVVLENGEITRSEILLQTNDCESGLCVFEYVYFARPDSTIDALSVYEARYRMGEMLAREFPASADVVCGVPDSGLDAAAGFAAESGLKLVTGFVKNRYIGRSFIYPDQGKRESAVRLKLNPLAANVAGKRVVMVDDSIVRGTTSEKIVRSLREAGAKEVHVRISSPPFRYTCHYGTDIDDESALIANRYPLDEIKTVIGADSLGYLSVPGLKEACAKCSRRLCAKCFSGEAHTPEHKKDELE